MADTGSETSAKDLALRIHEAQLSGTMSTVRALRTEVLKALRDRNFTDNADDDDLSIVRRFYRDPYTLVPRKNLRQEGAFPAASQPPRRSQTQPSMKKQPQTIEPRNRQRGANTKSNVPRPVEDTKSEAKTPSTNGQAGASTTRERKGSTPNPSMLARLSPPQLKDRDRGPVSNAAQRNTRDEEKPYDIRAIRKRYTSFVVLKPNRANSVRDLINQWLGEKGILADFGTNSSFRDARKRTVAETINTTDGNTRYNELSIVEETNGIFTTTITLAVTHDNCWVSVNVESADGNYASAPRVMRKIALKGSIDGAPDGWHSGLLEVGIDEVSDLYEYIVSDNRRLPVFVVGTDDDNDLTIEFRNRSRGWSRYLIGTACFVLLSPEATEWIAEKLGRYFDPSPWAIRSYLPNVNLLEEADSRRHRFTGKSRIASEEDSRISRRFGLIASEARLARKLPSELADAKRAIDIAKNRALLQGVSSRDALIERSNALYRAPNASGQLGSALLTESEARQLIVLRDLISAKTFDEELILDLAGSYESRNDPKVSERLNALSADIRGKEDEIEFLQMENEELQSALDSRDVEMNNIRSQGVYLRERLVELGEAATAHSYVSEPFYLDELNEFSDLPDLLPRLCSDGVVFTGDISLALEIDEYDSKGRAIKNAANCLRALVDYVEASKNGDHSYGVYEYLNEPPAGYFSVSPSMHASRESESTMNQYGHLRKFPVPEDVDPGRTAYMQAHFKLARIGMKSPRMHYLDDTRSSGCIYIGYLGSHLQTGATN